MTGCAPRASRTLQYASQVQYLRTPAEHRGPLLDAEENPQSHNDLTLLRYTYLSHKRHKLQSAEYSPRHLTFNSWNECDAWNRFLGHHATGDKVPYNDQMIGEARSQILGLEKHSENFQYSHGAYLEEEEKFLVRSTLNNIGFTEEREATDDVQFSQPEIAETHELYQGKEEKLPDFKSYHKLYRCTPPTPVHRLQVIGPPLQHIEAIKLAEKAGLGISLTKTERNTVLRSVVSSARHQYDRCATLGTSICSPLVTIAKLKSNFGPQHWAEIERLQPSINHAPKQLDLRPEGGPRVVIHGSLLAYITHNKKAIASAEDYYNSEKVKSRLQQKAAKAEFAAEVKATPFRGSSSDDGRRRKDGRSPPPNLIIARICNKNYSHILRCQYEHKELQLVLDSPAYINLPNIMIRVLLKIQRDNKLMAERLKTWNDGLTSMDAQQNQKNPFLQGNINEWLNTTAKQETTPRYIWS